jgi:hypothetical protein
MAVGPQQPLPVAEVEPMAPELEQAPVPATEQGPMEEPLVSTLVPEIRERTRTLARTLEVLAATLVATLEDKKSLCVCQSIQIAGLSRHAWPILSSLP